MKIGEAIYKAAQAEGPQAGPGESPTDHGADHGAAGDDKVVDADFEEVDERKKGQSA